jgi:DNA-binding NtrC family response regulator
MRILIADDEPKLGRLIAEMLELAAHGVEHVLGGREAIARLASGVGYDLVITDLRMPEVGGLEVLEAAKKMLPPPEVIVMTAYGTAESAVSAMRSGARDYLLKPFSMDELRMRVSRIAEERAAQRAQEHLVDELGPALVAESPAMRTLLNATRQVAATEATVLLLGESGTGKSQLARTIHYTSARKSGPFVEVHCAALPEALLESELFGHEKGAFTGADRKKDGFLKAADQGTLFLDEIGEISGATQVKLLRFVQNKEYVPLGASDSTIANVRVIAATNRDLEAAVRAGNFREDLYYRLNVFPIHVPPLRDRAEDILPLAERFLTSRGLPSAKLSPEARTLLAAHHWPGNVRELENALERAAILSGDEPIRTEHLLIRPPGGSDGVAQTGLVPIADQILSLPEGSFDLDHFERVLLSAAIERTGGNKAAASRLLGITRRRLYSRLKSLNDRVESESEE